MSIPWEFNPQPFALLKYFIYFEILDFSLAVALIIKIKTKKTFEMFYFTCNESIIYSMNVSLFEIS